jgi:hypothetical protein
LEQRSALCGIAIRPRHPMGRRSPETGLAKPAQPGDRPGPPVIAVQLRDESCGPNPLAATRFIAYLVEENTRRRSLDHPG